jgi:hypothetical protein
MPMLAPEASQAGPHTGRNNGNTLGRFFVFAVYLLGRIITLYS